MLQTLLGYVLVVLLGAVALVVIMGLFNLARGGSSNWSQKLMRLRIIVQFVAILFIVAIFYLRSHG